MAPGVTGFLKYKSRPCKTSAARPECSNGSSRMLQSVCKIGWTPLMARLSPQVCFVVKH